jgi:phage terminase small subunit
MAKGKLTPKQERFVAEYLIDLNATQAAIRAGYSAKTAQEQGSRLLSNVMVAGAVKAKQARLADKYEVTADRVVRELALIGFANMLDYVQIDEQGLARVDLSGVDRDQAAAIHEIKVESVVGAGEDPKTVEKVTFKLADKRAALVDLGKHLGLFDSAGDEALKEGLAALLQSGRKRAAETKAQSVH